MHIRSKSQRKEAWPVSQKYNFLRTCMPCTERQYLRCDSMHQYQNFERHISNAGFFFRCFFKTQQEKNSEISKTQGRIFKTQPKNLGVAWFLSIFINKICPKLENSGQNSQKFLQNYPKFSQNSVFRQLDLRSSPNKWRKKKPDLVQH